MAPSAAPLNDHDAYEFAEVWKPRPVLRPSRPASTIRASRGGGA
jgi:hypothetical protein